MINKEKDKSNKMYVKQIKQINKSVKTSKKRLKRQFSGRCRKFHVNSNLKGKWEKSLC